MGNRIFLVAAMLAGVAFMATSASAAPAADECLAKPKGPAPAGKHWYYQTNRAVQRKCWYLDDEGEKTVAATPRKQSTSANVKPDKAAGMQPPTADARAELVDEPRVEQPAAEQPAAPVAPPQREATQGASGVSGASDGASSGNWTVASRWPDSSESFAATHAPAISDPAPASRIEDPPPVLADAAPEQQPSAAVDNTGGVDLAPFAAALIFMVILGGALTMFFSLRKRRGSSDRQHAMSDPMHGQEMPWTGATARRSVAAAPERSRYSDEIDEVEQLLAIARQARGT